MQHLCALTPTLSSTFPGGAWPYVYVPTGCKIQLDPTIPASSALRKAGYVKTAGSDGLLLIGGLPVYQVRCLDVGA